MIDQPPGYLARFVNQGRPAALSEEHHRRLSDHLDAGELGLGIRDIWVRHG